MPRFDGTGPMGYGPGSGWGRGPCNRGMRQGGGYGYGRQRFISSKNELAVIEEEEKFLEEQLAIIREEKKALKDQQK